MPKFRDIKQLPRAYYEVDISWNYIEDTLDRWFKPGDGMAVLNLDPDYQRLHVWTPEQQERYIEYMLQGGEVGRNITLNHTNWSTDYKGTFELVDGKQRLEAVRAFMRDEVKAFGHLRSAYEDEPNYLHGFKFRITQLKTRREILELYLNINAGGTPHTDEELNRVRELLRLENEKSG